MESNDLHIGGSDEGWPSQSLSFNRSCLQWLGIVDSGSSSALNKTELCFFFPIHYHLPNLCLLEMTCLNTHAQKNTHTHTSTHYIEYQMVKQTLSSHGGELGCLSSHAFQNFWVSGPHTPALSSLHPGSQHSISTFYPEPDWNQAN